MAKTEKTFVKKDGDQTLTRTVTSPDGEVAARFDGYTEAPAASSSTATKPTPAKPNS